MFFYQKYGNPFKNGYLPYLQSYINLSYVSFGLNEGENIVHKATSFLETAEKQTRVRCIENIKEHRVESKRDKPIIQQVTPLSLLLNKVNGSPLFKDGFQNTKVRFDSLIEIATRELGNVEGKKEDKSYHSVINDELKKEIDHDSEADKAEEKVVTDLKKAFPDSFKAHHKYVAIVHADGDNIGKVVSAVGKDAEKLKEFSKVLIRFASEATEMIDAYGGAPIYMGGDDMLFIAPVATRKNEDEPKKTIFQLVEDLDELFKKTINIEYDDIVKEEAEKKGKKPEFPSLSFGISVTYYKYPLYEAKNMSFDLLEHVKHSVDGKNAVNVMFQKHSGQQIPFILHKHDDRHVIYRAFVDLVKTNVSKTTFLNSFTYKLETKKTILKYIAANKDRLKHFFKNNWNENYSSNEDFFKSMTKFIAAMGEYRKLEAEKLNKNEDFPLLKEEDFQLLYGALRFIHFIRSNDKN